MYKLMQICCLVIGVCCCSTLKTAYDAAKKRCDLKIKETYKVLDYTEEYSFTGEGVINIVFQLNDKDLEELAEACKRKKYKTISIKNLKDDGFIDANPAYGKIYITEILEKLPKGKDIIS